MTLRITVAIGGKPQAICVDEAHTANENGHHWQAVLDSYEGGDPIGWGDTPEEAVEDLRAEIEWRNE